MVHRHKDAACQGIPQCSALHGAMQVEVAIWDTAGQERFHSLAPLYYRDADAALLVMTFSFCRPLLLLVQPGWGL